MSGPTRTCVGCGRKAPQPELLRFTAQHGTLVPDRERRLPGRGAYTCRSIACLERAAAGRAFARTLRRSVRVPDELKRLPTEG